MKTNEFQLSMKRVGKLKVRKGFDFKIDIVYEDKVYEIYWNDQLISFETNKKKIKKEIVFLGELLETATGLTERDKTTLQQVYETVRQAGCAVIIPDDVQRARDGLHYSVEGHRTVAEAIARAVRGRL